MLEVKPIEDVISTIEILYPIDSGYEDTDKIGQELLEQAKINIRFDWRCLPEPLLREYERLCISFENRQLLKQAEKNLFSETNAALVGDNYNHY
jgi:hypothetical protein